MIIASMTSVEYSWKFDAPEEDEEKLRLLQLAYDAVLQVESNPVRILLR